MSGRFSLRYEYFDEEKEFTHEELRQVLKAIAVGRNYRMKAIDTIRSLQPDLRKKLHALSIGDFDEIERLICVAFDIAGPSALAKWRKGL